jgi:hypothetical protein
VGKNDNKPILQLTGQDGNVFMILGLAKRAAKKAGWDAERIAEFLTEAKSGDYDHVIQTCMEYFDVE